MAPGMAEVPIAWQLVMIIMTVTDTSLFFYFLLFQCLPSLSLPTLQTVTVHFLSATLPFSDICPFFPITSAHSPLS